MPLRPDLRDVTFIIPVYIDSMSRLRNLRCNLRHLTRLFATNILIGEQISGGAMPVEEKLKNFADSFEYFAVETHSAENPFHHTRMVNLLLARVETPFVCNLDCDMILFAGQYLTATQLLRWNAADFVVPYNDRSVHIPESKKNAILKILAKRPLADDEMNDFAELVWRGYSVGGALFATTETYRAGGGENENFVGWGWEDHERIIRFEKLGYRVRRVPGHFYHFSHPRDATSSAEHPHYEANENELRRVMAMSPAALRRQAARQSGRFG